MPPSGKEDKRGTQTGAPPPLTQKKHNRRGAPSQKETVSHCLAQATRQRLFTGAVPLLIGTGVLTCSVSDLGRFTPP